MSTLTLCPPCRSVVKHNAMHSPCQKILECISRVRDGGKKRAILPGCERATGTPMSQCHSQLPNCWQRCRKTGRNQDGRRIPNLRILYCSEVRFTPSVAAAPLGPAITQRASWSALNMHSRCALSSVLAAGVRASSGAVEACDVNSASGTSSVEPCDKITLRSMTFSSSRTFPGQEYRHSAATVFGATLVIDLLHNCA